MPSRFHVRLLPMDGPEAVCQPPLDDLLQPDGLVGAARRSVRRSRQWLLGQQQPAGHWCAEREGGSNLESEAVILLAFLGREKTDLARRLAQRLVETQLSGGGWPLYPGGEAEINRSVKAYFALKLSGQDPGGEPMDRARRAILAQGGADGVASLTRFYLALLGQVPYSQCPALPPEVLLMPRWFPANLAAVSPHARAILVPLLIVAARQPVRPVAPRYGIRELFLKPPAAWPRPRGAGWAGGGGLPGGNSFFRAADAGWKWCQRQGLLPLRRRALGRALDWILERCEGDSDRGTVFSPLFWSIVALKALGYPEESPEIQNYLGQFQTLLRDDPQAGTARVQPETSPVGDTALAVRALAASGVRPEQPTLRRAVGWLLDRPPADNAHTAHTLLALHAPLVSPPIAGDFLPPALGLASHDGRAGDEEDEEQTLAVLRDSTRAIERGLPWLLARQNDDGGWGALDRQQHGPLLRHAPLADSLALGDPSTPDLTGRVLEALGPLGQRQGTPAVDRAIAYLRATQEADGSWCGRGGVNYLYGTWQVLTGLQAVGVPADDPAVAAGANWLLACQQPGGGWGESPASYARPELRGQGPATASQTAWAVLGLLAAGLGEEPAVARGVRWLVATQRPDGTWDEPEFTGTGVPQRDYHRCQSYSLCFPLLALARWLPHCVGYASA